MVTGPANAISLMTLGLISPFADPGTPDYISLVLTLAFMVGVTQLLLGMARAGRLVEMVPHSVVVGFTTGAAVLIINSQLGPALGIDLPRGLSILANLQALFSQAGTYAPIALITCITTGVLCFLWHPLNRVIPALLIGIVGGTAIGHALTYFMTDSATLKMVAPIPSGWPPLSMPVLSAATITSLAIPTLIMTLIALTEAMAIARSVALKNNDKLDGNQEMIGQGLANLAGSFFSSYPSSGSFNRSGVNVYSGARTPVSAIFAAVFLVLILMLVSPFATLLPLCVVSALLFVVAWGLIDLEEIKRIWRFEKHERLPLVATGIATVTISLEWAILLGVAAAIFQKRFLTNK